jgi:hypothetical protein
MDFVKGELPDHQLIWMKPYVVWALHDANGPLTFSELYDVYRPIYYTAFEMKTVLAELVEEERVWRRERREELEPLLYLTIQFPFDD